LEKWRKHREKLEKEGDLGETILYTSKKKRDKRKRVSHLTTWQKHKSREFLTIEKKFILIATKILLKINNEVNQKINFVIVENNKFHF